MRRSFITGTILILALAQMSWGITARTITYQGVLKDSNGDIVADGTYSLTFRIYNVETGGTELWTETHSSVNVQDGLFSVELGSITAMYIGGAAMFDEPYWLEIDVGSTTMSPRTELTAVPYAIGATSVYGSWNELQSRGRLGINVAGSADTTIAVVIDSGKVGIGTMAPNIPFQLERSHPGNFAASIENTADPNGGAGLLVAVSDTTPNYTSAFRVEGQGENYFNVSNNGRIQLGGPIPWSGYKVHIKDSSGTRQTRGLDIKSYAHYSVNQSAYGLNVQATGGSSSGSAYSTYSSAYANGWGTAQGLYAYANTDTGAAYAIRASANTNGSNRWVFYGSGGNFYMNGYMGINSTSYIGSYRLHVGGQAGGTTTWTQISDREFKDDVQTLPNAIDQLSKIRGVRFQWNDRTEDHGHETGEKDIGVIAQEIEEVFPELVITAENGYKSVGYAKFTPILIEAVKELKAEKDALEERVEALESALRKQQLGRVTTTSAGGR